MGQPRWREIKRVIVPGREASLWTPALDYVTPGKLYRLVVETCPGAIAPTPEVVAAPNVVEAVPEVVAAPDVAEVVPEVVAAPDVVEVVPGGVAAPDVAEPAVEE